MDNLKYRRLIKEMSDIVKNAVRCTICGSPADLHNRMYYQCQKNSAHVGGTWVGIFTDLSMEDEVSETYKK